MAIEWREGMETGLSVIDNDHKKLISICNDIISLLAKVEDVEDEELSSQIHNTFIELQEYTKTHFTREEMIMKAIHFDDHRNHIVLHKNLIKVLISTYNKFKLARESGNLKENLKEISDILHKWLVEHVIKEDLKMKPAAKIHLMGI